MFFFDIFGSTSDPSVNVEEELNRLSDVLANHAVKNLASLDNVTVMVVRISFGNAYGDVDESLPLEGHQWECASGLYSEERESRKDRDFKYRDDPSFEDDPKTSYLSNSSFENGEKGTKSTFSPAGDLVNDSVDVDEDELLDFLMDDKNF